MYKNHKIVILEGNHNNNSCTPQPPTQDAPIVDEIDNSNDYFRQEEHYSSDFSEHLFSNSINNSLNILQNEEKELSPTCSSSKSISSKVEQVCLFYY